MYIRIKKIPFISNLKSLHVLLNEMCQNWRLYGSITNYPFLLKEFIKNGKFLIFIVIFLCQKSTLPLKMVYTSIFDALYFMKLYFIFVGFMHYFCIRYNQNLNSIFYQCTQVRFASFVSGEFITVIVVNPQERKLAKRTSVHWSKFYFCFNSQLEVQILRGLQPHDG